MSSPSSTAGFTPYRERLTVPIGGAIGVIAFAAIFGFLMVPLLPISGYITFFGPISLAIALLVAASLGKIEVADGKLLAGDIRFECEQIARVEELDQRNTRFALGPGGDPLGQVFMRPWLRQSVRVTGISDEPPYVLVGTKRPQALAAALLACANAAAKH